MSKNTNGPEATMELVATSCKVVFWHDLSRGLQNSDGWEVSVWHQDGSEAGGSTRQPQPLIGTHVHATELAQFVGPVLAAHLQRRASEGTYQTILSPGEVMGLRGGLAARIETHDWSDGAAVPRELAALAPPATKTSGPRL